MKITSLFINITKKSEDLDKKSEDLDKKLNDLAKEKEIDKYCKLTVEDKEKIINEINEMLKNRY